MKLLKIVDFTREETTDIGIIEDVFKSDILKLMMESHFITKFDLESAELEENKKFLEFDIVAFDIELSDGKRFRFEIHEIQLLKANQ